MTRLEPGNRIFNLRREMEHTNHGAEITVKEGDDRDTSYYCKDFNWKDLKNEMERKENQCDGFINMGDEAIECCSNKKAW